MSHCVTVINEDVYIELLELLELYSELLLARFGLLDQKYVQRLFSVDILLIYRFFFTCLVHGNQTRVSVRAYARSYTQPHEQN